MKNKSLIASIIIGALLATSCSERMRTARAKATSADSTIATPVDTSKTSSYFYYQPQQGYK